jgi:dTDP-4-dehydrorhamnose reductase
VDLLVFGGSGFLGHELVRQAKTAGHNVDATYYGGVPSVPGIGWHKTDIRYRDEVCALIRRERPDVVINAAYRQSDWVTTADGAVNVALAAAAVDARLVHVSSDVIFSGNAAEYDETAVPDPTTAYGAAKAAAETAIRGISPAAAIVRTSLIIGDGTSQHERFVHCLAAGAVAGILFTDVVRCPVHVADLAAALLELGASTDAGIQHVAGADAVSRFELGELIAERDGLDPSVLPAGPRADGTYPGPLVVRLDCTDTQARLTTRLRGVREFLLPTPA